MFDTVSGAAAVPAMHIHDCPICARVGDTVLQNHFITCPAYRALVHLAHCAACPYHRSQCSIDWCAYKTKEQKLKERLR